MEANKLDTKLKLLLFILVPLTAIRKTYAIVPPDFVVNISTNLVQIFSFAFIFLSTFFVSAIHFVKVFFNKEKINKWVIIGGVIVIIVISFLIAINKW